MGRGFEPSVIVGDHCALALGELRYDVAALPMGLDHLQFYGFIDYGSIWNVNPPAGTPQHDEASSTGIGARFGWSHMDADLQVTNIVERPVSATIDSNWSAFFDIAVRF